MFGHRLLAPQGLDAPLAGRASIRQSLQCRESLGGDDEERLRRVQISGSFHKLVAIDVGNEAHGQTTITEVPHCIVSYGWTQVGAANTDVNDIAHALAGIPSPGAAPHAVREVCHLIQHCVYLGYHVLTIDEDCFLLWGAQSHMEDRAILRNVNLVPQKHSLDAFAQARILSQCQEQPQRLIRDAVLRVVQVDASGFEREALAAPRVISEERSEVKVPNLLVMFLERLPARALC